MALNIQLELASINACQLAAAEWAVLTSHALEATCSTASAIVASSRSPSGPVAPWPLLGRGRSSATYMSRV
jgi:hypothetical protein